MAYGSVLTDVVKSSVSGPVTFQNTSGTEIGTLCRAWVNFNGTGTVAIRASFNVSSITDNGTGNYTVNFTNAMSDANYAVVGVGQYSAGWVLCLSSQTTSSATVRTLNSGTDADTTIANVAIFR